MNPIRIRHGLYGLVGIEGTVILLELDEDRCRLAIGIDPVVKFEKTEMVLNTDSDKHQAGQRVCCAQSLGDVVYFLRIKAISSVREQERLE